MNERNCPPRTICQPNSMTRPRRTRQPRRVQRRGMLLIIVLIVIAMLSLAGYAYSELMLAEHEATLVAGRQVQARELCQSGLAAARSLLAMSGETLEQAGGVYDNPLQFQGQLVYDDGTASGRGRFTVVAPLVEQIDGVPEGMRFGLENESARLNLNFLLAADEQQENGGRELLMALPGMTVEIADAILDWLDPDDEPREFGAEVNDYTLLDPPYAPRNGAIESIEELLLVRGVTPWLLFGADANRNGVIDGGEAQLAMMAGIDNADGSLNRGWAGYLTLYSQELNLRADGSPRIDINQSDMQTLYDEISSELGEEWATFIVAYRQNGPADRGAGSGGSSGSGGSGGRGGRRGGGGSGGSSGSSGSDGAPEAPADDQAGVSASVGQLDLTQRGRQRFTTVLDLVGATTQVQFVGASNTVTLTSPLPNEPAALGVGLLPVVELLTVNSSPTLPGRININQAPRAILTGIPGLSPQAVETILSSRMADPGPEQPGRQHETWLLAEGLVTLDEMKQLIRYTTCGGSVYRAQIIGYTDDAGPQARIEAVIDATSSPASLLFWRDISHLGRGFPAEVLGVQID